MTPKTETSGDDTAEEWSTPVNWEEDPAIKAKQRRSIFLTKIAIIACLCLHDQNKSGFLEDQLLSSQSKQFEKFSKSSAWLVKADPPKKPLLF